MAQIFPQEKVYEVLKSIGLSKNEIKIYLDLIKNNNSCSSALEISKRTKIHRSNTYDSLRKLVEKGFVKNVVGEDKKLFKALDPKKIREYIEQKKSEFDSILPNLKRFSNHPSNNEDVCFSKGSFSLREAVLNLLELDSPILTYGASEKMIGCFGEPFLDSFHKKRLEKKVEMKHIYNEDAIERIKTLNNKKLTEARYLPHKYDANACTTVCGDRVLFFIFSEPLYVITIINPDIANAYKKYFEILWNKAKKD